MLLNRAGRKSGLGRGSRTRCIGNKTVCSREQLRDLVRGATSRESHLSAKPGTSRSFPSSEASRLLEESGGATTFCDPWVSVLVTLELETVALVTEVLSMKSSANLLSTVPVSPESRSKGARHASKSAQSMADWRITWQASGLRFGPSYNGERDVNSHARRAPWACFSPSECTQGGVFQPADLRYLLADTLSFTLFSTQCELYNAHFDG